MAKKSLDTFSKVTKYDIAQTTFNFVIKFIGLNEHLKMLTNLIFFELLLLNMSNYFKGSCFKIYFLY